MQDHAAVPTDLRPTNEQQSVVITRLYLQYNILILTVTQSIIAAGSIRVASGTTRTFQEWTLAKPIASGNTFLQKISMCYFALPSINLFDFGPI